MAQVSVSSQARTETPINEITDIARKVIPTMARYDVPMSPENYRIWFEAMTGSNPELVEEIATYQEKGTIFSEELNESLYDKYFGQNRERKLLEEISKKTYQILKESLDKVISTSCDTQEYTTRLSNFASRLEDKNSDPIGLKEMISEIVADTKKMEKSSVNLKQQLEQAKEESNQLRHTLEEVKREATKDVLTGLFNRKYMEKMIEELYYTYKEENIQFSVIMLDIDHFKAVNDNYGHQIGDAVLEYIGGAIKGAVKGRDIPARYGGEEFIILLPMTTCENACRLAENLRNEIANKSIKITKTQKKIGAVTISAGVAQICKDDVDNSSLVERADRALYLAKHNGRNNVKSENDLPSED